MPILENRSYSIHSHQNLSHLQAEINTTSHRSNTETSKWSHKCYNIAHIKEDTLSLCQCPVRSTLSLSSPSEGTVIHHQPSLIKLYKQPPLLNVCVCVCVCVCVWCWGKEMTSPGLSAVLFATAGKKKNDYSWLNRERRRTFSSCRRHSSLLSLLALSSHSGRHPSVSKLFFLLSTMCQNSADSAFKIKTCYFRIYKMTLMIRSKILKLIMWQRWSIWADKMYWTYWTILGLTHYSGHAADRQVESY